MNGKRTNGMEGLLSGNSGLVYDPEVVPKNGIVFLLCDWSESKLYLQFLFSTLEEHVQIPLYVYNIDGLAFKRFSQLHPTKSHGKGETFWIHKGKILNKVLDYNSDKSKINSYNAALEELLLR